MDSLGLAAFGHSFGALDGKNPKVFRIFDGFKIPSDTNIFSKIVFLASAFFPILRRIPTEANRLSRDAKKSLEAVADVLLAEAGRGTDAMMDKSVMGLLRELPEV